MSKWNRSSKRTLFREKKYNVDKLIFLMHAHFTEKRVHSCRCRQFIRKFITLRLYFPALFPNEFWGTFLQKDRIKILQQRIISFLCPDPPSSWDFAWERRLISSRLSLSRTIYTARAPSSLLNHYSRFNSSLNESLKYEDRNAENELFSLMVPHLCVIDFVEYFIRDKNKTLRYSMIES